LTQNCSVRTFSANSSKYPPQPFAAQHAPTGNYGDPYAYAAQPSDGAQAYQPAAPRPGPDTQLALYDEEKAEAQMNLPPPQNNFPYQHRQQPFDQRHWPRPADHTDSEEDDYLYDERPRRNRRRKHRTRDEQRDARDEEAGSKGHRFTHEEKGLAASTLGGAGGALLGHSVAGGGAVGLIGGILAGALGASKLEEKRESKKSEKSEKRRRRDKEHGRGYYSDDGGRRGRSSRTRASDGYYSDDY